MKESTTFWARKKEREVNIPVQMMNFPCKTVQVGIFSKSKLFLSVTTVFVNSWIFIDESRHAPFFVVYSNINFFQSIFMKFWCSCEKGNAWKWSYGIFVKAQTEEVNIFVIFNDYITQSLACLFKSKRFSIEAL